MSYAEVAPSHKLNEAELFDLRGGYQMDYGCESNVCAIARSGAEGICKDAYCRSGVGPAEPEKMG